MGFNDDGQCIPRGDCPDGYARLDDDETGRCYAEGATKICPPNNIRGLQSQACPTSPAEAVTQEASNDTSTEVEVEPEPAPEPEITTCEAGFVLENGRCAALDSNCGGVPCTASEKEDSTTTDHIPGTSEQKQNQPQNQNQNQNQNQKLQIAKKQ